MAEAELTKLPSVHVSTRRLAATGIPTKALHANILLLVSISAVVS